MAMDIAKYNNGTVDIVIADAETGAEEVSQTYAITESLTPASIVLEGELTTDIKTMTFTFHNESGYICNYKSPTFTKTADHFAKIAGVTATGGETSSQQNIRTSTPPCPLSRYSVSTATGLSPRATLWLPTTRPPTPPSISRTTPSATATLRCRLT